MKVAFLGTVLLAVGCGSDDGGSSSDLTSKQDHTLALAISSSALPECGEDNVNQLIYLTDELRFVTCVDANWQDINLVPTEKLAAGSSECADGGIKINGEAVCNGSDGRDGATGAIGETGEQGARGDDGADGIEIAEVWSYGVETYVGSFNAATESATSEVYIGDIQATVMTNNHVFVAVSGVVAEAGGYHEFSYSFWDTSADLSTPSYQFRKIQNYANTTIALAVVFEDDVMKLIATVDVNSDYTDNMVVKTSLVKQ